MILEMSLVVMSCQLEMRKPRNKDSIWRQLQVKWQTHALEKKDIQKEMSNWIWLKKNSRVWNLDEKETEIEMSGKIVWFGDKLI